MPFTKQQQDQHTETVKMSFSEKVRRHKNILIIGSVLVVVAVVVFNVAGGLRLGENIAFEQYLNKKYGQNFVAENVRVEGAGLGVKGSWMADAYPRSNPSLKFEIGRSQTTGNINVDSFLQVLWTEQGSSKVEAFLAEQLPRNDGYRLQIMAGSTTGEFYQSIQGKTPSLTEMLENHKDELSYNLIVRSVVHVSKEEPVSECLDEAFKVASFVKEMDVYRAKAGYI